MVTRLVLGCGTIGHAILEAAERLPGTTTVLDPDPSRVEALRNERVAAEEADVTDAQAIGGRSADVVVVAGDDAGVNHAATRAAAAAYPEAHLLAYAGDHPSPAQREAIRKRADSVVRPGADLLDRIVSFVDDETEARGRSLRRVLEEIEGRLSVVMHDNPDPDAIASALALVDLAERFGVSAEACYYGEISHQENRAFVNLLDLNLRRLDPDEEIDDEAIALVDHSRPGVNDQLDPETRIRIVLDHHPVSEPVEAHFVDIRPDVGATSTLLADYLRQFAVEPGTDVATALLWGIRVDTDDFTRDITAADFEAAAYLLPHADTEILERVESPSLSADTLDTIATAIKRRHIDGATLASCVGPINDRDTLAQSADRLLAMEGITTTLVSGFVDGTIYISARSRRQNFDLGAAMRAAFDDLGSAGGHTDMAGAQIPMGVFEELGPDDEERLADIIEEIVAERFFEVVRADLATLDRDDADGSTTTTTVPDGDGDELEAVVRRVSEGYEDVGPRSGSRSEGTSGGVEAGGSGDE